MTLVLIILLIILNIILSHLVATTGEKKDIGYNTVFWTSFLFSPLIGLLLSIASPNNPEKVSIRWYRSNLELILLLISILVGFIYILIQLIVWS
jgi:hypothetical protein